MSTDTGKGPCPECGSGDVHLFIFPATDDQPGVLIVAGHVCHNCHTHMDVRVARAEPED